MINEISLKKIAASTFSSEFVKPLYNSYCFSRIPATVEHLLTGKKLSTLPKDCFTTVEGGYDIVILFFIDAFGWRFFEKYADRYPFLSRFLKEGLVSKITSQFPSTTAAHVTTMNSSQEVGQTGIYEWFYYEPIADRIIAPLLFSIAGEKTLGNLEKIGVTPHQVFPKNTFYLKLKKQKIDTYVVYPENIVNSHYSKVMTLGSHSISYYKFSEGLKTLSEGVTNYKGGKSYFAVYFPDIDSAGHRQGLDSSGFDEAVEKCMADLEVFFQNTVFSGGKKTAILFTADHGMVGVNPKTTHYINKEIPKISSMLKVGARGNLLTPAGSCRDMFLHVKPELIPDVLSLLQNHLKGIAECYLTKDLIQQGFFGCKPVSQRFLDRIADVVVLPYAHQSVWWYERGKFEQNFYAAHGGLTPQEMESLFLFLSL
ncbi:MAG: alkaline phosphatase family protein [Chlamydiae bacterium]|nr:alkaline phosphatase family protein [Chlamydiota bacterium]